MLVATASSKKNSFLFKFWINSEVNVYTSLSHNGNSMVGIGQKNINRPNFVNVKIDTGGTI